MDRQKILPTIQDKKNMRLKLKPIKTGKELATTQCLGCKDYANNFKQQEGKMTNKAFREKSNCVVCRSSKSRFLKQKYKNKNNSATT